MCSPPLPKPPAPGWAITWLDNVAGMPCQHSVAGTQALGCQGHSPDASAHRECSSRGRASDRT